MSRPVIHNPFGLTPPPQAGAPVAAVPTQAPPATNNPPPPKYGVPPPIGQSGPPPPVASPMSVIQPTNFGYQSQGQVPLPVQTPVSVPAPVPAPVPLVIPSPVPGPAPVPLAGGPSLFVPNTNIASPIQPNTNFIPDRNAVAAKNYGPPPAVSQPPPPQEAAQPRYGPPPAVGATAPITTTASPLTNSAYPQQHQSAAPASASSTPEEKVMKFPSPIELIANTSSETYRFHTKISPTPPPAASRFVTVDEGNCGPRYIRSTLYTVPSNPDVAKKASLPIGLIIQPLNDPAYGEEPVPVVDSGADGPLRCARCRSYLNALDTFTNGGTHYICFLCSQVNPVPDVYFSPLTATGQRVDLYQRPELCRGSIEYVATPEYITRPPQPLNYLFVLEVGAHSVESGLIQAFVQSIKAILKSLPAQSNTSFGLLTFDQHVQFYNFHSSLQKPQILVVTDFEEQFLPCKAKNNLLVNYQQSHVSIDYLLDHLPAFYNQQTVSSSSDSGSVFGSALKAGMAILNETGGKMIVFQSSVPTINPGKIEPRLQKDHLGTDREREFYKPQTQFYELLAEECSKKRIGIDLFAVAKSHFDLATLAPLCQLTGGQMFYYPRFTIQRDRLKLHHELHRVVTRTTGFDAIMRVRASTGLQISDYFGNFQLMYGTDMEMGTIDCDKTVVVKLRNEGKLPDQGTAGIQVVLLYTTSSGQRRIRVHSLLLNTSNEVPKIFATVDLESLVYLMTSQAIKECLSSPLTKVRRILLEDVIQIVHAFRLYCSKKSFQPQILVLPDALKVLPIYIIGLLKSPFMKVGRVSVDFRIWTRLRLFSMSVGELTIFLYPRMFALHRLGDRVGTPNSTGQIILPPWERLLHTTMDPRGCFLMDNGHRLFLWIGKDLDPSFFQQVFTVDANSQELYFTNANNELSSRINAIISNIQSEHPTYKQLSTVRQGTEGEIIFMNMLVEERVEETMSHADALSTIHREVSRKLGQSI